MSIEAAHLTSHSGAHAPGAETLRAMSRSMSGSMSPLPRGVYVSLMIALMAAGAMAPAGDFSAARMSGALLLLWSLLGAFLSLRALKQAGREHPQPGAGLSLPQKILASLRPRGRAQESGAAQFRRQEAGLMAALGLAGIYILCCLSAPGPQGALWLAQALMPGLSFVAAFYLSQGPAAERAGGILRGSGFALLLASFLSAPYNPAEPSAAMLRAELLGAAEGAISGTTGAMMGAAALALLWVLMAGFFVQILLRAAGRPRGTRGRPAMLGLSGLCALGLMVWVDGSLPAWPGLFSLYVLAAAMIGSCLAGAQAALPRVKSRYQIYQM